MAVELRCLAKKLETAGYQREAEKLITIADNIPESLSIPIQVPEQDQQLFETLQKLEQEQVTPELVTTGWQMRWNDWGARADLNINVPDFPGDGDNLATALERGDKPIYIPLELATQ